MSRRTTDDALHLRSLPELRALFAQAQRELLRSRLGTASRRAALADLEALSLAIALKRAAP